MTRSGSASVRRRCSCEAAITDRLEAEIQSGLDSVVRLYTDRAAFLAIIEALLDVGHERVAEIAKRSSRSVDDFEVRVATNASFGVFGPHLMVGRIEPPVVGGGRGWWRGGEVSCQDRGMTVRMSSRGRRSGGERVRLRIGSVAKAVLVTGQAYQDPKDALNEFVSNAPTSTSRRGGAMDGSGWCCAVGRSDRSSPSMTRGGGWRTLTIGASIWAAPKTSSPAYQAIIGRGNRRAAARRPRSCRFARRPAHHHAL